ncbi:MAG: YHS domain-containing (seleno)protein [Acidobacteriota bacterium]
MTTFTRLRFLFALAAVALMLGAGVASAGVATSASNGLTSAGAPLAIHGFDAVAYHQEGESRRGLAKHQTKWQGAVYRFTSKANLETFESDPQRYAPAFGGFCAYGVSVGKKFDGDPEVFKIVDGRLYFNLNPEIQATWEKSLERNLRKAEKQWQKIASVAVDEL